MLTCKAAAPAWFVPALQGVLNPLLVPMQISLAKACLNLVTLHKPNSSDHKRQLYDGSFTNFDIVPFNDGTMPSQAPVSSRSLDSYNTCKLVIQHNLPPLLNVAAIRALTAVQSTAYAVGYGLGDVDGAPARRAASGRAIVLGPRALTK